jgi:hypothetical protein
MPVLYPPRPRPPGPPAERLVEQTDRAAGGLDALALEPGPPAARDQDLGEDEMLAIFLVGEEASTSAYTTSGNPSAAPAARIDRKPENGSRICPPAPHPRRLARPALPSGAERG